MIDKYKISADEFAKVSFERMATRPNTATSRGESGMSPEALKKRFDAPSRLLRDKFNALIALIAGEGDKESLLDYLQTGIDGGKTLREVLADITAENGAFASYLSVGDTTLAKKLAQLDEKLKLIAEAQGEELEKLLESKLEEADEHFNKKLSTADELVAELHALRDYLEGAVLGGEW